MKSAFDRLVLEWPEVTAETMFGCPSYRADGSLFAVLVADGVVLTRLPDDHCQQVGQTFETGPFRAGERTITKRVRITVDEIARLAAHEPHIEASYDSALEECD